MCCHQCSASPTAPIATKRQFPSANTAVFNSSGTPLVQITYLGSDHTDSGSVQVNGIEFTRSSQTSISNLKRACTTASYLSNQHKIDESRRMEDTAAKCCSAGLNRTHTINICIKPGSEHDKQCPSNRLPSKIRNTIRKKLSFLGKLRNRTLNTSIPFDGPSADPHWRDGLALTSPSLWKDDVRYDTKAGVFPPSPHDSSAELDGDRAFHSASFPAALSTSTPNYKSVAVHGTYPGELSDNAPAASELHASQAMSLVDVSHADQPLLREVPVPQMSTVSAMSSSWQGSSSDYPSSRQMSLFSAVSDFTPNTSMSLSDGLYSYAASSNAGGQSLSSQPPLTLDIDLLAPPSCITGEPFTESPTSDEDVPKNGNPLNDQQSTGPPSSEPYPGNSFTAGSSDVDGHMSSNDHWEVATRSPPYLDADRSHGYNSANMVYHELEADYLHPATNANQFLPELNDVSLPLAKDDCFPPIDDISYLVSPGKVDHTLASEPLLSKAMDNGRDVMTSHLTHLCRQYALSWSLHNRDTLSTYLQDTFDLTLSYYLTHTQRPKPFTFVSEKGLDVSPTIDAALIAVSRLLSGDVPTPYQLVSLAFFSLSLLCLSLETHDLQRAVHALHLHARSWSRMIESAKDQQLFEELIDDLWPLPKQASLCDQVRDGAPEPSSVIGTTAPMWWNQETFIIEVASIFISLVTNAHSQHPSLGTDLGLVPSEPPPSFEEVEVMKEEEEKLLLDLCSGESQADPRAFQQALEQARLMGLLTTLGSLESFTHRDPPVSDGVVVAGTNPLIHFLVKVLGGRCIGRAALWLKDQLRSVASRVVSHPQGLTVDAMSIPPTEDLPSSSFFETEMVQDEAVKDVSHESIRKAKAQKLRRGSEARKPRSLSRRTAPEGPFECKLHNQTFTGAYAYGNYLRHLRRTKQHGGNQFKCPEPECGREMARIEHFKAHMEKWHGKLVIGRSGDYSYVEAVQDARVVEHELAGLTARGRGEKLGRR